MTSTATNSAVISVKTPTVLDQVRIVDKDARLDTTVVTVRPLALLTVLAVDVMVQRGRVIVHVPLVSMDHNAPHRVRRLVWMVHVIR